VGTNDFDENSAFSIEGAENDVDAFERLLRERSRLLATTVEIRVLKNKEATQSAIQEIAEWVGADAGADDIGLFFFSGRSFSIEPAAGGTPAKTIAPYDYRSDATAEESLLVPDLVEILSKSAGRVTFIIDA
jgi:hypothetical protein